MFIIGVGTAAPATRYTQAQCYDALQRSPQFDKLDRSGRTLLRNVLTRDNGIRARALALDALTDAFDARPDVLHERFSEHAPRLAQEAAEAALRDAGLRPADIDGVIVSTCTGYLCPGLSSYMIERLELSPDIVALDLVGHGCGAALPNLRTAEALIAACHCENILSICVEVCSAACYIDNDPGVLVSACLFGDGAGAAVVSRAAATGQTALEWKTAASHIDPQLRDALRFEQRDGMLRNILTREVPELAAACAELVLDRTLAEQGLAREAIRTWIWHAGGRKVLDALRLRMGLEAADLQWSAEVLRDYGNVSSACVYFVLKRALAGGAPPGWWWMSSFGAGFSCHGALLKAA